MNFLKGLFGKKDPENGEDVAQNADSYSEKTAFVEDKNLAEWSFLGRNGNGVFVFESLKLGARALFPHGGDTGVLLATPGLSDHESLDKYFIDKAKENNSASMFLVEEKWEAVFAPLSLDEKEKPVLVTPPSPVVTVPTDSEMSDEVEDELAKLAELETMANVETVSLLDKRPCDEDMDSVISDENIEAMNALLETMNESESLFADTAEIAVPVLPEDETPIEPDTDYSVVVIQEQKEIKNAIDDIQRQEKKDVKEKDLIPEETVKEILNTPVARMTPSPVTFLQQKENTTQAQGHTSFTYSSAFQPDVRTLAEFAQKGVFTTTYRDRENIFNRILPAIELCCANGQQARKTWHTFMELFCIGSAEMKRPELFLKLFPTLWTDVTEEQVLAEAPELGSWGQRSSDELLAVGACMIGLGVCTRFYSAVNQMKDVFFGGMDTKKSNAILLSGLYSEMLKTDPQAELTYRDIAESFAFTYERTVEQILNTEKSQISSNSCMFDAMTFSAEKLPNVPSGQTLRF